MLLYCYASAYVCLRINVICACKCMYIHVCTLQAVLVCMWWNHCRSVYWLGFPSAVCNNEQPRQWFKDACRLNGPDCKVHGANMGPTWGWQVPGGPHVCPMNLAIRGLCCFSQGLWHFSLNMAIGIDVCFVTVTIVVRHTFLKHTHCTMTLMYFIVSGYSTTFHY